jgi:SAM-dependent methyltransferase
MTGADRDQPNGFFDSAYGSVAPWDIGQPQPALVALFNGIEPLGPVLEVGSGTGDLALFLAERGLSVIGVDSSEAAVAQAQARAAEAEPVVAQRVEFRVGDGLRPTTIPEKVGSVVDSGFFHLFGADDRKEFARELATKLPTGGRYYLLGFAFHSPMPNAPREVRADELGRLFSPERGWQILVMRPAQFVTVRGNVPAIAACIERVRDG